MMNYFSSFGLNTGNRETLLKKFIIMRVSVSMLQEHSTLKL
jgi:hypothetical protein